MTKKMKKKKRSEMMKKKRNVMRKDVGVTLNLFLKGKMVLQC